MGIEVLSYQKIPIKILARTAADISICSKYTAPPNIGHSLLPTGKPNSACIIELGTPPKIHCADPIMTNVKPMVDMNNMFPS